MTVVSLASYKSEEDTKLEEGSSLEGRGNGIPKSQSQHRQIVAYSLLASISTQATAIALFSLKARDAAALSEDPFPFGARFCLSRCGDVYRFCREAVIISGNELAWTGSPAFETKRYLPFVFLVTLLLFARGALYSERSQRPGLSRIVSSLFQVMLVALVFAVVNGEQFSSYYIFYGSCVFAVAYIGSTRFMYEKVTGVILRAAGYRRRGLVVGASGDAAEIASALENEANHRIEIVGYVSIPEATCDNHFYNNDYSEISAEIDRQGVDEVILAGADFPENVTVELVDQCHQRGVRVRIAPSSMEILVHRAEFVPGGAVPLFELRPPVFEGLDFLVNVRSTVCFRLYCLSC